MPHRTLSLTSALLGLSVLLTAAGCAGAFNDYADPTAERSEKWVDDAGREARAGMMRESGNDPLNLRELFMSQKARDIERNLGVD